MDFDSDFEQPLADQQCGEQFALRKRNQLRSDLCRAESVQLGRHATVDYLFNPLNIYCSSHSDRLPQCRQVERIALLRLVGFICLTVRGRSADTAPGYRASQNRWVTTEA